MTWLLPEQLTALRQLQAACSRAGADIVIIGAAAYRTWFNDPGRYTEDVDVAIAADLEEFALLAEALAALGWRQEAGREHRWYTPGGACIDLLPAGQKLRAAGHVEWPRSGMVMSLVGFEHVFARAVTVKVSPEIALRVVPIPVLALLKIVSFLDSPYDRSKDAQDILSILERYEIEGDRRFGLEVYESGIDYDRAGAFLLGQDLAALSDESEAALVDRLVAIVREESTPQAMLFARATATPELEKHRLNRNAIFAAFAAGFRQGAK